MAARAERRALCALLCLLSVLLFPPTVLRAQAPGSGGGTIVSYKPKFLPPADILAFLGIDGPSSRSPLIWEDASGTHVVDVRRNDAANLLLLAGAPDAIAYVESLIAQADVPPRQIEIEVQIIEVSASKARDVGIDWADLVAGSGLRSEGDYAHQESKSDRTARDSQGSETQATTNETRTIKNIEGRFSANLSQAIHILDEAGAATIRNAPKILTLNNRKATILDGSRVTYVSHYASFENLVVVDSLDAGLTLSVTPSLGESGYLTLDIQAELTSLSGSISGTPVKSGQMLDNTVICMSGESVVLGGLTTFEEEKTKRRFPILGYVLPFLFSREITLRNEVRSFMILTPRVLDLASNLDEDAREALEERE